MNTLDQDQRTYIRHGRLDTFFNAGVHLVARLAAPARKTSSPLGTDVYRVASQWLQNGWQTMLLFYCHVSAMKQYSRVLLVALVIPSFYAAFSQTCQAQNNLADAKPPG